MIERINASVIARGNLACDVLSVADLESLGHGNANDLVDYKEHSMQHRYATADVFTTEPMSGNPVAVVLDAEALTVPQMQALAAEFNYVETTFVLSPADLAHTAHVRIFTPDRDIPFAGHPNIGTAFLLARRCCTDRVGGVAGWSAVGGLLLL